LLLLLWFSLLPKKFGTSVRESILLTRSLWPG
jgi:hypothetical protein